ncbi:MAG: hypothetical protein CM15mP59_5250 [Flavobacteriaceae bacterium]|nr:MAG: hypothetical protein CM15mP59_5250 [Flavobacteriaceae bacterium]
MKKLKIKTGDTVRVIAGDHKGSEGKILKLFKSKEKAIVEGVNVVKRHTKPNAQNPQGGIVEKKQRSMFLTFLADTTMVKQHVLVTK